MNKIHFTGLRFLLTFVLIFLFSQPLWAQGSENAMAAFFYLLIAVALLLLAGLIISLFFLAQRKKWQRVVSVIFGGCIGLLGTWGLTIDLMDTEDWSIGLLAAGIIWIITSLLLPGNATNVSGSDMSSSEMTGAEQINRATGKNIKIAAFIFLGMLLFSLYGYLRIFSSYHPFSDPNWIFSLVLSTVLLLLQVTGIVFLLRLQKAGWFILTGYFVFVVLSSVVNIGRLFYLENFGDKPYPILIPALLYVYLAYEIGSLVFLFRPKVRAFFNLDRGSLYLTLLCGVLLAALVIWNNFSR